MNQEKEFTDLLMQHQHIIYKICLMYANEKTSIKKRSITCGKVTHVSRTEAASVHGSTGLP